MKITYRVARLRDVLAVADNLRAADRREVELSTGSDPRISVIDSFCQSDQTWVALAGDTPVAIFGIAQWGSAGIPWMVGTEAMVRHQRELVRTGRSVVADFNAAFPALVNYVHAENHTAIRWLRHLGFVLRDPIPYGPHGAPFHPFYRVNHV